MLRRVLPVFILLSVLLASCALRREDVKLAGAKEMLKYVSSEFGDAELVRTVGETDDRHAYIFRDRQCGFEYTASSAVFGEGMDGTVFYYRESRTSNFSEVYYSYFLDRVKDGITGLEAKYGLTIELEDHFYGVLFVTVSPEGYDPETIATEIGRVVRESDVKGIIDDMQLLDERREAVCEYFIGEGRYMSKEDMLVDHFIYAAASCYCRAPQEELKFLRRTRSAVKDLEGFEGQTIAHVLGNEERTPDSEVDVYWFEYRGKEYFIADVNVTPNGYHYSNYVK